MSDESEHLIEQDEIEHRLRDTNEVLLAELAQTKRREDRLQLRVRSLERALQDIANKKKLDACAAASMQAIARTAVTSRKI